MFTIDASVILNDALFRGFIVYHRADMREGSQATADSRPRQAQKNRGYSYTLTGLRARVRLSPIVAKRLQLLQILKKSRVLLPIPTFLTRLYGDSTRLFSPNNLQQIATLRLLSVEMTRGLSDSKTHSGG